MARGVALLCASAALFNVICVPGYALVAGSSRPLSPHSLKQCCSRESSKKDAATRRTLSPHPAAQAHSVAVRADNMRRPALLIATCALVDALQLHHKTVRRRDVSQKALRLDQPLLRIGNKVTNWVPAVGAVAGATVVGAAVDTAFGPDFATLAY